MRETRNYVVRWSVLVLFSFLGGLDYAHAQRGDLPTAGPEKLGFSSERLERLDSVMRRAVEEKQYGGIVTLLARHGKVESVGHTLPSKQ
jgi:hypothetical protein